MKVPGEIGGNGQLGGWLNRLRAAVLARTLLAGTGYKLKQTPSGVMLEITPGRGGSAPAEPTGGVLLYAFIYAIRADSLECYRVVDPGDDPGAKLYVAKHPNHRVSLTSEIIDGVTFSYTYIGVNDTERSNNRRANDGTNQEFEVMFPRYKINDRIFIAQSSNGTGVGFSIPPGEEAGGDYLDLTHRVWARRYIQ